MSDYKLQTTDAIMIGEWMASIEKAIWLIAISAVAYTVFYMLGFMWVMLK
jgi:hypothetical protein